MSNELAIAAVTRTLRTLLDEITSDDFSTLPQDARPTKQISVTTVPPDKALNGDGSKNLLNLFLYHTAINAAWRNMDLPRLVKSGETAPPLLALNLSYLLTAYGEDNNDLISHVLLGHAMRILHDNAILDPNAIKAAFSASNLHQQIEHVRITPQPVSLDELSKLWTTFQTQYRISAAYQVSVVLIESKEALPMPAPVLSRGKNDQGVSVLASSSPTLLDVRFYKANETPPRQLRKPGAEIGDMIGIVVDQLEEEAFALRFSNMQLAAPIDIDSSKLTQVATEFSGQKAVELRFTLGANDPHFPSEWLPGWYSLSLVIQRPEVPSWTTNDLPFALVPKITNINPSTAPAGTVILTLDCTPQLRQEQRAAFFFGKKLIPQAPTIFFFGDPPIPPQVPTVFLFSDEMPQPVPPQPLPSLQPLQPTEPAHLRIKIMDAKTAKYLLRLRIDGVDSIPVIFDLDAKGNPLPLKFADDQQVTIT